MASPSSLNHCVVMCSAFSIRPTIATVGVGSIGRPGAAASQVARGFGNGDLAPFEGIKINVSGIAVNGEGDQLLRDSCSVFRAFAFAGAWLFGTHRRQGVLLDANDSGIGAGRDN